MNTKSRFALGATVLLAFSAAQACDYPDRPHIPDGSAASKDDMIAAKTGVRAFLAGVDEYLLCIESKEKTELEAMSNPDPEELQKRSETLDRTFDAANAEKATIGELLNKEIRLYNAQRKASE